MKDAALFVRDQIALKFFNADRTRAPIILGGLPEALLEELYNDITAHGTQRWRTAVGAIQNEVPVVFVPENRIHSNPSGSTLNCAKCTCDYAVNARSSCAILLTLLSASRANEMPVSISNAGDVLGRVSAPEGVDSLIDQLNQFGLPERLFVLGCCADHSTAATVIGGFFDGSAGVSADERLKGLWTQIDALLDNAICVVAIETSFLGCFGLPNDDQLITKMRAKELSEIIKRFGSFLGHHGIREAIEQLIHTRVGSDPIITDALKKFEAWLFSTAGVASATAFERSTRWYYRQPRIPNDWWTVLTASVLEKMLAEAMPKRGEKVVIDVDNDLSSPNSAPDIPWIVSENADVTVSSSTDADLTGCALFLGTSTELIRFNGHGPHKHTVAFPSQEIKGSYRLRLELNGDVTDRVNILSLKRFQPHAYLEFLDATSCPVPSSSGSDWKQEVTLHRGGATRIKIHAAAPAHEIYFNLDGTTKGPFTDGHSELIELEDGSILECVIKKADSSIIAKIRIVIDIAEPDETATRSYLEALIQAHRYGKKFVTPIVLDSPVRRLELQMMKDDASWRPTLICSKQGHPLTFGSINWSSNPVIGDVAGIQDVRPAIIPPAALIAARKALLTRLDKEGVLLPDINLGGQTVFQSIAETYLSTYLDWFKTMPDQAVWFDTMVLYGSIHDPQSGGEIPTAEPTAILLSPFHPIKFSWLEKAQRILKESLLKPCPTVGLLAARYVPDCGAWKLGSSQSSFAAFFSRACSDTQWSVLWNAGSLGDELASKSAENTLDRLGLKLAAVASGFEAAEVKHALTEVTELLSARSTLRCAITGTPSGLTDGVFEWVSDHFGKKHSHGFPNAIEIYDGRDEGSPSDEQLGHLASLAEGKIQWFAQNAPLSIDLAIIDELSVGVATPVVTNNRSAIGSGGLTRLRIKSDTDQAQRLVESRVATPISPNPTPLDSAITMFEGRALLTSTHVSGIEYKPNQIAIGRRLVNAQLVAVTSGQIDLACLTRGIEEQEAFLWHYELPSLLDSSNQAGYFLITRPTDGMRKSIEAAIEFLIKATPSDDDIKATIREVSRRGIPVLKKVSEGGSNARGELGTLLVARYLQDIFRPAATRRGIPVRETDITTFMLPVDPFEDVFEALGDRLGDGPSIRPDLLVFSIRKIPTEITIRITPIEVKFRENSLSDSDAKHAHQQAKKFVDIIQNAVINPQNAAWEIGGSAVLAECLDYAFRLHSGTAITNIAHDEWTSFHAECIASVLQRTAKLEIHESGIVIAIHGHATVWTDTVGNGIINELRIGPADTASIYREGYPYDQETADIIKKMGITLGMMESVLPVTRPIPETSSAEPIQSNPTPLQTQPTNQAVPLAVTTNAATQITTATITATPLAVRAMEILTPEIRAQVADAFSAFVGNSGAVSSLRRDALLARIQAPVHLAKAILLTGNASTGKTTLAKLFGSAIGVPFIKLDGRAPPLQSREALFEAINASLIGQNIRPIRRSNGGAQVIIEYPPFLLFVDEVHLIADAVQQSMLTMVESRDRTAVIDANRTAHVPLATFVFATTRASEIDGPLASRCEEIQLLDYSVEEVAEIVRRSFSGWSNEICTRLAVYGRRVPRISLELANSLATEILVCGEPNTTTEQALETVAKTKLIDELGLTSEDRRYLQVLMRHGGPLGMDPLLNMLGILDKPHVTDQIEPYLQTLGFIKLTAQGRQLTPEGRQYVDSLSTTID